MSHAWIYNPYSGTVEDGDGVPVCTMPTLESESSYELVILDNARLISAAPEMLAALKQAIEWCHQGHGNFPARGCGLCKPMHAAIAKAEGRS